MVNNAVIRVPHAHGTVGPRIPVHKGETMSENHELMREQLAEILWRRAQQLPTGHPLLENVQHACNRGTLDNLRELIPQVREALASAP
jgi:hypothetical protein